jgi:hypothetical protein
MNGLFNSDDLQNLNTLLQLVDEHFVGRFEIGICRINKMQRPYINILDTWNGDLLAEQMSIKSSVEFINNRIADNVD